jgi:hypothetical protein
MQRSPPPVLYKITPLNPKKVPPISLQNVLGEIALLQHVRNMLLDLFDSDFHLREIRVVNEWSKSHRPHSEYLRTRLLWCIVTDILHDLFNHL